MMHKNLKLSSYTIKRYEPKLGKYFFYNSKNKTHWETDFSTGSVISVLDGTLSFEEIMSILSNKNPQIPQDKLYKYFEEKFDFLLKEEFLCVEN